MGAYLSKNVSKVTTLVPTRSSMKPKLTELASRLWWVTSNSIWIGATSAIILVAPVLFQYERECQMFELQAQFLQAQQAAYAPKLN